MQKTCKAGRLLIALVLALSVGAAVVATAPQQVRAEPQQLRKGVQPSEAEPQQYRLKGSSQPSEAEPQQYRRKGSSQPAEAEPRPSSGARHKSLLRIPAHGGEPVTRDVTLGLSKSMIVELPRDVRDVLVSDPKKVDAVVSSSRRAYLIGMEVGQANAFFFDQNGDQIATLEVRVERDLAALESMLKRLVPGSKITLEAINDNIILSGSVENPNDASRAADIVARVVEDREKVLNMLGVQAKEQILLKVTVAEMERNIMKQLGLNWDGNFAIGEAVLGFGSNPAFVFNDALANIISPDPNSNPDFSTTNGGNGVSGIFQNDQGHVGANLRLLEQNGLIRTLAEPNLTAISGETANFLAGGEFPVPVGEDNGQVSIDFKKFGVGLAFTPVVMSEGRISMKISTEVSELTNEGSIVTESISVPALKVRRANTTVELPSGGSLVMAGLISDDTRQAVEGLPGLKNLPVLGKLFRSRDFVKSETELVIIVTPYTAKPARRQELARPDDNFSWASDKGSNLMGRLNSVYGGKSEAMPECCYEGDFGFMID